MTTSYDTRPLPSLLNASPDTAPYAFDHANDFNLWAARVEATLCRQLNETEETFAAGAWAQGIRVEDFAATLKGQSVLP